jgi:hypothetical protein
MLSFSSLFGGKQVYLYFDLRFVSDAAARAGDQAR